MRTVGISETYISSSEKQIIEGGEIPGKKGYHYKRVHGGIYGCV